MGWAVTAVIVALVCGFFLGAGLMLEVWKESAQRGQFEVGNVVYRVQPIAP